MSHIGINSFALETEYFRKIEPVLLKESPHMKNIGVVVVAHILSDAVPYLKALDSIFSIEVVFAKQKSINYEVFDALKNEYQCVIAEREKICDIAYILKFLDPLRDGYIFIDIGGYFSGVTSELKNILKDKFLGCIEDTENGLRKYYSKLPISFPFYQVARSPLKQNEDFLVGQAIAFSADSLFRENGVLLNGQKVGVFGYGKIGNGVANALRAKQANVAINDTDPVKVTHAHSHGFIPQDKDFLLRNSEIICIATGTKVLSNNDFFKIKNGAFIFSVTSSDDSIDINWLNENFSHLKISAYVTQYSLGDSYFYLLNEGNAINFIHGTTVGFFILLVQAEIIACAIALANGVRSNEHFGLQHSVRKEIAQLWLDSFTPKYKNYDE